MSAAEAPVALAPATAPAAADKGDYLDQAVSFATGKAGHATVSPCKLFFGGNHRLMSFAGPQNYREDI